MKKAALDLTGKVFSRLTVESRSDTSTSLHKYWNCVCVCGGTSVVTTSNLTGGQSKSCGCLRKELAAQNFKGTGRYKGTKKW